MLTITTIIDDEGDSFLSLDSTIKFAAYFAELQGFERVGTSNVSEACYYARPDCDNRLRIAAHGGQRDKVVSTCIFPKEARRSDGERCVGVPLEPYQVVRAIKAAIADYDAQVAS